MVVNVDHIREKGLTLDQPVSLELLTEALEPQASSSGFKPTGPADFHVVLQRVSAGILVEGSLTVPVQAPCKRCNTDVTQAVPVAFSLSMISEADARAAMSVSEDDEEAATRGGSEEGSEGSFVLDNVDQEVFDGKTIDLDPIVREQVLLAMPMNAVCREDCQGLCPSCGQNLNEKKCGCEARVVDPRLAVLKDIKLN